MAIHERGTKWRRARIGLYVVATAYALVSLLPFIWSLYTSLKPTSEVFQLLVPWHTLTVSSYASILHDFPFARWFVNSLVVAVIVTVGNLVVNTFAGYAFARLKFPLRGFLFYLFLGIMMIPGQVVLVPIYIILVNLGWINSYAGLTIPFLLSSTMVFLSRQFFLGIPKELEEAARIDGVGHWGMFFRIMLPLSKPLLAAQTILTFQGNWNSFLWPLLIGQTTSMYTLPVGLNSFYGQYNAYWNSVMAGMLLLTVPMMIIFVIFQRQFVQGVASAGLKG
ncbi:carbohydrate ABC transporter membrane protein 2 (CUT1 family) [Alicyclobacillus sacchari]|uniref:Carbohydrate ABC transporter membrane protein 2 (CUT1 family) n=1 Tax=Alicyclobacillus sacchari TaxID=392010 RepID=A0A4R8LSH0_9BACL|nr:carbohydrate ABC transporter permease [Alicyclobacillus sacchari]TDY49647.1 carbohydrate ABC transporter membrane protein 2 (CUT1 family) [Alicyclobacillus sacchari]GMA58455.1 sn-glycerol-3-phosphate transport system permease protein UgpE [Alicyclobacillus sacchari]